MRLKDMKSSEWLGGDLVEPSKAHAPALDATAKLGHDQEVGKAAGLHLQVPLQDEVGDGGWNEEKEAV